MGSRLLQILLLVAVIHPAINHYADDQLMTINYMLSIRLRYHITCLPSTYFRYKITVRELDSGIKRIVAKHSGGGSSNVDGIMIIDGKSSWGSSLVYNDFGIYMTSNCSTNGKINKQAPIQLQRCSHIFLCDMDAYFIILNDHSFAAEPLYV